MAKHSHNTPHSSSIQKIEHDDEANELHITFASGGTHCFKDCPHEVFQEMKAHDSPGSYFHQNVRRKYQSSKVD